MSIVRAAPRLAIVLALLATGCTCSDADGDGSCDLDDRCPGSSDAADLDGDALPDGCDACPDVAGVDRDGDGTCDADDPCPLDAPDDCDGNGRCDSLDAHPADATLRMEHVQGRGTHNSYHQAPPIPFDPSHVYSHVPLDAQLGTQGVRTFELDVHREAVGHRVYHIIVIDPLSSCDAFLDCLRTVADWSRQNRRHAPLCIFVEPKDDTGGMPLDPVALDALVRSVFPGPWLLTPDDVQRSYPTLREALQAEGWPLLQEARGRVMLVLLDTGAHRDAYTSGGTSLAGRAMFALSESSELSAPLAAVVKPGVGETSAIQAAHAARMLVATNVCNAGQDEASCQADRVAALAEGVHMLKDDFPAPIPGRSYWLDIPGGTPSRCNPVTAPAGCASRAIEDLAPPDRIVAGEGLGPASGNGVRLFDGSGAPAAPAFQAYGAGAWGTVVHAADVGADAGCGTASRAQILTGPGPGPVHGPHVRAFRHDGAPLARVSFYAYATLRYGVNVGAATLLLHEDAEIVTGAGPGDVFGPHVRAFDAGPGGVAVVPAVSFFAYGTLRYGVNVSGGDLDDGGGDGRSELVTGAGPGPTFSPQVRGFAFDGTAVSAIARINLDAFGTPGFGVNVAAGEASDAADIAAARGPGPAFTPDVRGFADDGSTVTPLPGFQVTLNAATAYGARVGLGNLDGDTAGDVLAGEGRDPASPPVARTFAYTGALVPLATFDAFPGGGYGVNVASGTLVP